MDIYESGHFIINQKEFQLSPKCFLRTATNIYEELQFSETYQEFSDSVVIQSRNALLDLYLTVKPDKNYVNCFQAVVEAVYKDQVRICDIYYDLEFIKGERQKILKGPIAIASRNPEDNIDLCPYTDKVIEYNDQISGLWIIGSNYEGCSGIEWIKDYSIRLYDHTLHFARLYNQTNLYDKLIDYMPKNPGDRDRWSFLIFNEKPTLIQINRWFGDKKAAFALTNDADVETELKLKAVYYGSTNADSPKYLNQGLIANGIKVSNTVFSTNFNQLNTLWTELVTFGNTIGYHTYSPVADYSADTAYSLSNLMSQYKVRLWIDHGLPQNPEDFGMSGGDSSSPYYILDAINGSDIDYAWLGDTPFTNPFNAYDDPWRLPHKLYKFKELTKPVWFFGRTRMETWEYFSDYYCIDMKNVLTAENLDRLLYNRGLCIGYTHLCFTNSNVLNSFYFVNDDGDLEVRDEVNSILAMLNYYQKNRGLWIETVETIFDRMLAIEDVKVISSHDTEYPQIKRIFILNGSDYDLENLCYTYNGESSTIPFLKSGEIISVYLQTAPLPGQIPVPIPIYAAFESGMLKLSSKMQTPLPNLDLDVYNIKGQRIFRFKTTGGNQVELLPFLIKSSGIYLLRIKAPGYITYYQKINFIK